MEDLIFYVVYTYHGLRGCSFKDPISFHTNKEAAIQAYNRTKNICYYQCDKCGHKSDEYFKRKITKYHYECKFCGGYVGEFERRIEPLILDRMLSEYNNRSYDNNDLWYQRKYWGDFS